MKRIIVAEKLTRGKFKAFGSLIDFPRKGLSEKNNLFRIVVREADAGWRIAYLVVRDKKIGRLERHSESLESFEPVDGQGFLFVADRKNAAAIRCFFLDTPVILKKGVWHGVVSAGGDFDVKITENLKVTCEYWPLGFELGEGIESAPLRKRS